MKLKCGTCRFGEVGENSGLMECRRRAPVPGVGLSGLKNLEAAWPVVWSHDWCGEWEMDPDIFDRPYGDPEDRDDGKPTKEETKK